MYLPLSLIKISGEDSVTFLQGQLTNDINSLDDPIWQHNGYCNPKGRLIALLQVWRQQEDFFALLSTDLVEPVIKRLRMYVMRSKVVIELLDNAVLPIMSDDKLAKIDNRLIQRLSAPNSVNATQRLTALKVNNRYLVIHNTSEQLLDEHLTNQQSVNKIDLNNGHSVAKWQAANIADALPQVTLSSSELFIPQMLNLDLLGGISFKKGCYTGQEIVARMHYLGKLKQRMFVCKTDSVVSASPGDKIYSDQALTKVVGNIVAINDDLQQALAVLRLSESEQTLFVNEQTSLKRESRQPYEIPS